MIQLKELTTIEEMSSQLETIQNLYSNMTLDKYQSYLQQMIPHNYKQLIVIDEGKIVGITGFWQGVKLWSGPYMEIDNFVVVPEYRKKGVGKMMTDYINVKAKDLGLTMIVLDAYVENFTAHKFYYNQGYIPRGYHFLKILNPDLISS